MRRLLPLVLALTLLPAAPGAAAPAGRDQEPQDPASFLGCTPAIDASRVPCAELVPAVDAAGGDVPVGWQPIAARPVAEGAEIMAVRGRAAIRVRRAGAVPDVLAAMAGRELVFARRRPVPGRPIRAGSAFCTSAWVIVARGVRRQLSAGHCAASENGGRVVRPFAAVRRPPQPGVVLGRVRSVLFERTSLDTLKLPVPRERGAAAVVWRGADRPPWAVTGVARPTPGRVMCFTGRTSGVDRCGRVAGRSGAAAARLLRLLAGVQVVCTTATARPGDSGGPVYTRPRSDGSVSALGTSTLVIGRRARLCFTPIAPVLDVYDASLVTAG